MMLMGAALIATCNRTDVENRCVRCLLQSDVKFCAISTACRTAPFALVRWCATDCQLRTYLISHFPACVSGHQFSEDRRNPQFDLSVRLPCISITRSHVLRSGGDLHFHMPSHAIQRDQHNAHVMLRSHFVSTSSIHECHVHAIPHLSALLRPSATLHHRSLPLLAWRGQRRWMHATCLATPTNTLTHTNLLPFRSCTSRRCGPRRCCCRSLLC
jgi:hypothetical protein